MLLLQAGLPEMSFVTCVGFVACWKPNFGDLRTHKKQEYYNWKHSYRVKFGFCFLSHIWLLLLRVISAQPQQQYGHFAKSKKNIISQWHKEHEVSLQIVM